MADKPLPPGVRALKALEVTRPCGCKEILLDKKAQPARAGQMAAKPCYSHASEARYIARVKIKGGLLCDTCNRPPYFGLMRVGDLCGRSGVDYRAVRSDGTLMEGGCPGHIVKIPKPAT